MSTAPSASRSQQGVRARARSAERAARAVGRTRLVLLGFALALTSIGAASYDLLVARMRAQYATQLRTLLAADTASLREWMDLHGHVVELAAATPEVAGPVADLLQGHAVEEARARLDAELAGFVDGHGYAAYAVLDPALRVVAASDPTLIGGRFPLDPSLRARLRDEGGSAISRPSSESPPGGVGAIAAEPVVLALAAIRRGGAAGALLAFRLRAAEDLTRQLNVARAGRSGETYAIDRHGRMVSESRFDAELRAVGLLPRGEGASSGRLEVRDPGAPLRRGHPLPPGRGRWPPTWAAARALAMADAPRPGVAVDAVGYRGYRGVEVIGAATWLPELDVGVVTEVERAEAYATLDFLLRGFWALFGALCLASLGLFVYGGVTRRLTHQVEAAHQLGQYRLERLIGEGGMGRVYRATHALLARPTAIKIVDPEADPEALARFEREVRVTAQLSHPNTVAVYDFGRTPEGGFYYAMEYLPGITLAELVATDGPQPEARVLSILVQVAGSLAEAHDAGLVHRDIKPANIMLTERGGIFDFVKVLDFGLARDLAREPQDARAQLDELTGTPLYMSPEAIADPASVDASSDLYQVGAVAYYLLTGAHLFQGSSLSDIYEQHLRAQPVAPSDRAHRALEPDLEALVLRCLAKDRAARPRSARELLDAVEACRSAGRWSQRDARAWWERWSAERKDEAARRDPQHPHSPTVVVDIERRLRAWSDAPGAEAD